MDISTLATSDNEKEGKWFRVELYGKKQPFALKILGKDSDEVLMFQREQVRKLKNLGKDAEDMSDEDFIELLEAGEDAIINRIVGISSIKSGRKGDWELIDDPVTMNGVELKNDEKSYKLLIDKIPAIKDFILSTSRERVNFLD